LIGDQAKLDEGLPRLVEPFTGHGQALAQGAIGVKTQALGIGHRDQKERESTGLMAELIKHVLTDQALIHPTELTGDGAEFGQRNGAFVHPGCLLGDAVWTCSHDTGHIWEVILPHPSTSMLLVFKDLQPRQSTLSLREFLA
jgi:hypothetical protein